MNRLEVRLEFDKGIHFEMRDRAIQGVDIQEGIGVDLCFKDRVPGFKRGYHGTLTSMQSVHGYLAHVIWVTSGVQNPLVISSEKREGRIAELGGIEYEFRVARFDREEPGLKVLFIPFEKIEFPEQLKLFLEKLERKHYIRPRRQTINACDYWDGFVGASDNLWSGSVYPRGSVKELTAQGVSREFIFPSEEW